MLQSLYAMPEWAFLLIVFILGASVGSFLNVVIYRLPKKLYAEFKAECDENAEATQKRLVWARIPDYSQLNLPCLWPQDSRLGKPTDHWLVFTWWKMQQLQNPD